MSSLGNNEKHENRIRELESRLSVLKLELEESKVKFVDESKKREFYQFVADFTFGWELWFEPKGEMKYCSPSCFDLTGYTSNQVISSAGIAELLVYQPDQEKYNRFVSNSLDQLLVNQSLEFRILTRTKQLRWCIMNVRGVYDRQGKYLGARASVQDITRLKRAIGHIHEMESVKELENITRRRLQTELTVKDRELVSFLLQLSQKNELLSKAAYQLKNIQFNGSAKEKKQFQKLLDLLESKTKMPLDWVMVENQLEQIHPGFFSRLLSRHSVISVKDKKLCAYLRLGLSSKEISGLQNITPKSVEISRVRLRKKLKLPPNIRLVNYLYQL